MSKLLPCPFCGNKAECVLKQKGFYISACTDQDCVAWDNNILTTTKKEAIAMWNTRIDLTNSIQIIKNDCMELADIEEINREP